MKVILLEDIDNLGRLGDTVSVKAGYARNFLIPRKLALQATEQNLKTQQNQIQALERRKDKAIDEARSLSDKLAGVMLSYTRKSGAKGQLFGSVTNMDIAASLAEQNLEVDRRDIVLSEPIKGVGEFDVTIKLHHDVAPVIKVTVLPEGGVIPESVVEEATDVSTDLSADLSTEASAEVEADEAKAEAPAEAETPAAVDEPAEATAAPEEAVAQEATDEEPEADVEADPEADTEAAEKDTE
jgi:large subunit ribosomal protein L9